jgi:hypothetical protein
LIVSLKFAVIVNVNVPMPSVVDAENGWPVPPEVGALCDILVDGPTNVQPIESGTVPVLPTNPQFPAKLRLVAEVVVKTTVSVDVPSCEPPGFAETVFSSVTSPAPVSDWVKPVPDHVWFSLDVVKLFSNVNVREIEPDKVE